jgi:hypothetical protein
MAKYMIRCTEQSPSSVGHNAAHIVTVALEGFTQCYTVSQVYLMIDRGDTFTTRSPSTGREAAVTKHRCTCGYQTLRSTADSVQDNNLDNLPRCDCR